MAPKRKARAGSATPASSQPLPQTQSQQMRGTRTAVNKRRQSDASAISEISEAASSSQVTTKKGAAKRGRPKTSAEAVDTEVIIEEDSDMEVNTNDARGTPACDVLNETDNINDTIEVVHTTSRHVHFGGDATEERTIEEATATSLTPHPRSKMSIKRRLTPSPGDDGYNSVKRLKSTRTSLPASLSQEEPTQVIQEVRFAPLKEILNERIHRLSMHRAGGGKHSEDVLLSDEDMLVLDGQEEFSVAQIGTAPLTPTSSAQHTTKTVTTAGTHDREAWQLDRKKLQDAVISLKKEADEARTKIQVLDMELESIGFGMHGTSSLDVLTSIRESFARARDFLETELPGSLPDDASNEDVAEILVANVKEFAGRLRTADRELDEKTNLAEHLGVQIDGLITRLANRTIDNTELTQQVTQLDGANEFKDRDIAELAEDLLVTENARDKLEKQRDGETARATQLEAEKSDLELNIERLSESLQKYHTEEARLSNKINKMEEEHRATVTAMNKEREATVQDLENRLDVETAELGRFSVVAAERLIMIESLEVKITVAEKERDDLRVELEEMTEERDDEIAARDQAQASLDEKSDEVTDLEARVRRLEEELTDYNEQLDELRTLSANERDQRERAEAELDARNTAIEDLEGKLHEQGKAANELRLKLFEVQTQNAQKFKELEDAASERDLQYQSDMTVEVKRREDAEEHSRQRDVEIDELEKQLEDVETEMRDLMEEKDKIILEMKDDVAQKDVEIQNLRDTEQSIENAYRTRFQDNSEHIRALEDDVEALNATIAERETTIHALEETNVLTTTTYTSQIEERDVELAALHNRVAELAVVTGDLETERARLERKVEDEAENMLEYQNGTTVEIEKLKATIRDKQHKIQTVEDKVRETDRQWEAVLAAREEQITTLTTTTETQSTQLTELKLSLEAYVHRASIFISGLQTQLAAVEAHVDHEGGSLQGEGEDLLQTLMMLEVPKTVVKKQVKSRKIRREFDSAIGSSVGGAESVTESGALHT